MANDVLFMIDGDEEEDGAWVMGTDLHLPASSLAIAGKVRAFLFSMSNERPFVVVVVLVLVSNCYLYPTRSFQSFMF